MPPSTNALAGPPPDSASNAMAVPPDAPPAAEAHRGPNKIVLASIAHLEDVPISSKASSAEIVDALKARVETLPTKDLARVAARLGVNAQGVNADTLRNDAAVRSTIAVQARTLVNKVEGWL